jgi:hypothetical protein
MGKTPHVLDSKQVDEINRRLSQPGYGCCALWMVVIFALLITVVLRFAVGALLVLIVGLICTVPLRVADGARRTTKLTYTSTDDRIIAFQGPFENLEEAKDVRLVKGTQENRDLKSHGGAAVLTVTEQARVGRVEPPFIDANIVVWGINAGNMRVLFFPDALLVFQQSRYRAVPYESLSVDYATTQAVRTFTPGDAEIIGQTWEHVNLDGGPDLRFSDNQRLYTMSYGLVQISSSSGFSVQLQVSNKSVAAGFSATLNDILSTSGTQRGSATGDQHGDGNRKCDSGGGRSSNQTRPPNAPEQAENRAARETLGVPPDANRDDIIAAYRKMAKMYHPDRVADLGPEFGELAERRMKEINAAYAELIQSG